MMMASHILTHHHPPYDSPPTPPSPTFTNKSTNNTGGFCFLNYVAGAALHAVERWGLSRVTVVDFDLHHGTYVRT